MPDFLEAIGLQLAIAIGVVLIVWYLGGNELMRRRSHRLAIWTKRMLDPLGGKQSIRWLSGQAFRLEVEGTKAPIRSLLATGLVESWDTPLIWAWNRLHGRRDIILLQLTLREQPMWGLEVYRPGTLLAGDARHMARQEGWTETTRDELVIMCGGEAPLRLATELLDAIQAERRRLLRLAVRRQGHHLTLGLAVPDPNDFEPRDASRIAQRLAERVSGAN
ncbi:MAG TPA: hypothetical protein VGL99_23425 [Chloroflexota bacterium]